MLETITVKLAFAQLALLILLQSKGQKKSIPRNQPHCKTEQRFLTRSPSKRFWASTYWEGPKLHWSSVRYCTMKIEALFTVFSHSCQGLFLKCYLPTLSCLRLQKLEKPTAVNNSCALTTPQTALLSFWQHLAADPLPRVQEGFAPTKM